MEGPCASVRKSGGAGSRRELVVEEGSLEGSLLLWSGRRSIGR